MRRANRQSAWLIAGTVILQLATVCVGGRWVGAGRFVCSKL